MLLDANGNAIDTPPAETPAPETPPANEETPPAEKPPEVMDRLDPIFKPMGQLSKLLSEPPTDSILVDARALLGQALDAFAKEFGHTKVRRGKDYDIYTRPGDGGRIIIGMTDNTTRGRDFVAAWNRFMADMDAQAREAQSQMTIQVLVQKIMALEGITNQLLMKVAALEAKVR